MKWDNLTMSQKQALMKIYVNNGVTNLDEIVNHYNRFSEGGSKETVESPNTVLYSKTPRELVGNVINTRPVPNLITMTEVPRVGAGINLPFKELIDRFVLESKPQNNNINVINTDSINRPVSYITRPSRINRFDDGGEFTLTDVIEGNSYLDYLKNKYKYIDPSKDSNKLTASDVTNAISSNIKSTTEGLSKTAQKVLEDKEEKRQQKIYENKLMLKSLAQAAEFAAAGYTVKNFAMNHGWVPNTNIVNGVYQADQMQKLANGVGFVVDGADRYYADTPYKKSVSDMELIGDAAGYIGGTNWFRNTPLFGRYGSTIDDVLDKAGFASAGYDLLEVPVEWIINQYGKKSNTKEENTKKYGGKVNRFNDGGVKSKPTRQEYIQNKIEEEKQIALEYSRNRTTPDVPYFDNTQTEEEYNKNKQEDIKRWENYIRNAKEDWVINYAKGNLERVKNEKYNPIISGQSCAYTATGNYSQNGVNRRCSGNLTFEDYHKKYGFIPTTKENLSPGDLVQDTNMGYPTHMLTFDSYNEEGAPLYNYARGNTKDIVIKGKYPMDNSLYYTFVGTPEDSARWTRQYFEEYPIEIPMATIEDALNKSNKKKYGGKLKKNKK